MYKEDSSSGEGLAGTPSNWGGSVEKSYSVPAANHGQCSLMVVLGIMIESAGTYTACTAAGRNAWCSIYCSWQDWSNIVETLRYASGGVMSRKGIGAILLVCLKSMIVVVVVVVMQAIAENSRGVGTLVQGYVEGSHLPRYYTVRPVDLVTYPSFVPLYLHPCICTFVHMYLPSKLPR